MLGNEAATRMLTTARQPNPIGNPGNPTTDDFNLIQQQMKQMQQVAQQQQAAPPPQLDMNRNSLPPFDRQLYENFGKFCQPDNTIKATYNIRNNMRNHMNNYMPYPTLPFQGLYYRQLAPLDFGPTPTQNFLQTPQQANQRVAGGMAGTGAWPFDQMNDFCSELLNRDKHYWTDEETTLMLELYEENRNYFNDTKTKKTKVWSVIANIINKRFNTSVNSEQCSQKYRNLKAEFLKVVDPNTSDGGAKKFGRHFIQMKRLIEHEERKGGKVVYTSPQNAAPAVNMKSGANDTNTSNFATLTNVNQTKFKVESRSSDFGPNKMADTAPLQSQDFGNLNAAIFTLEDTKPTIQDIQSNNTEQPSKIKNPNIYSDELKMVFEEFFKNKSRECEKVDSNTKMVCLGKCLTIFKKIIDDGNFV
eukprot:TCONS_00028885-protein